ncbi:MAG: hypothetical protein IKW60_01700 [Clostridia bacterium]|nr:hypothetical protein [Clostridia bacterium]
MRTVLHATEGKLLTDGTIYGKEIFLAEGTDPASFYEISEQEYLENEEASV